MLITPSLESYICITRAVISEPPSNVMMFTLHSATLMGDRSVLINATWNPPAKPNGKLGDYLICLSPKPLIGAENPVNEDLCEIIPVRNKLQMRIHTDLFKKLATVTWNYFPHPKYSRHDSKELIFASLIINVQSKFNYVVYVDYLVFINNKYLCM